MNAAWPPPTPGTDWNPHLRNPIRVETVRDLTTWTEYDVLMWPVGNGMWWAQLGWPRPLGRKR